MLLHRIMGIGQDEEVFLAEESMEELLALDLTEGLLESGLESDRVMDLSGDSLLGKAFHLMEPADLWIILTDRYSKRKMLDAMPQGDGTVHLTEEIFFQAIVEYYSTSLAGELFCERCSVKESPFFIQERIDRLSEFLEPLLPRTGEVMEVCAGSGMATQSLARLGLSPWVVDSDRCELCQGLKAGLLDPSRSILLDGRLLGHFFEPRSIDTVVGFMVGLIDDSNWDVWREILLASSTLAREMVLYTVYSKVEADRIAKALGDWGWDGELIDNRQSISIYDQWAYLGRR